MMRYVGPCIGGPLDGAGVECEEERFNVLRADDETVEWPGHYRWVEFGTWWQWHARS